MIPRNQSQIPPAIPRAIEGTHAPRRPAATIVRGQPPAPGQPCLIVITMGEHYRVQMLAERVEGIFSDTNFSYLTIEIGTELSQATTALQTRVPAEAKVLLITDAPLDEVATVRATLPTAENIIEEVKVDDTADVIELPFLHTLQRLLSPQRIPVALDFPGFGADSHRQYQAMAQQCYVHDSPSLRSPVQCIETDTERPEEETLPGEVEHPLPPEDFEILSGGSSDTYGRTCEIPGATTSHEERDGSDDDFLARRSSGFPGMYGLGREYASPTASSRGRPQQHVQQAFPYAPLGRPAGFLFMRSHTSLYDAAEPSQRPASTGDATRVLSEKLDLPQGFCASDEWKELALAQDLPLLANLVTRALKDTKNPNLKPMLRRLVEGMASEPALAERVFVVLQGANESCDDRVSLALSRAQEEWVAQPIWDGTLNQDIRKVVDLGRQAFRSRLVDELAQEKVKELRKVRETDEIETYLAFRAGLHGPLELGGEKPDAKYTASTLSGVEPIDIASAELRVLAQEGEQDGKRLWEFLATWKPFQHFLRVRFSNDVARIEEVVSDTDRMDRLERQAATEVENANVAIESVSNRFRQDHITRRANQLGQEEELQLWLALTRKAWSSRED